jgi:hypothetical protein
VADPLLRILIPSLITEAEDGRRLAATLAGLPPGLDAVAHPLVQTAGVELLPPALRSDPERAAAGGTAPEADVPPGAADQSAALDESHLAQFVRPDHPACPVEPLLLGPASGKWSAIREAVSQCGPCEWIAVADGDDAYDLVVLPAILWRAQGWEGDLFQGQRGRIVLDPTELGRRRALLEPVLNELLRLKLAAQGVRLEPSVTDLQSGLFVARRPLLEEYFALPRMDGADPATAPGPLPWGSDGGELHLHAYAARKGAQVRGHPVRSREGRVSGLTLAAIGRQLRGSTLFADTSEAAIEAAAAAASLAQRWQGAEATDAREAARVAFP